MLRNDGSLATVPALGWSLLARRTLFGILTLSTALAVAYTLARVLGADGFSVVDGLMLLCFTATLPWTIIGFWNAVIGFCVLRLSSDPVRAIVPIAWPAASRMPTTRNAMVVPVYNEDPDMVIRHLESTLDDLAAAGGMKYFEAFLLSDTQEPDLIEQERRLFDALKARSAYRDRLHYRRRSDNAGYKTGNLWEWLGREGHRFDHMIVLDADSVMRGDAVMRLVRLMEANPRLGILQTLVTGLPTLSAFSRVFQFGMRHGMRTYTTGSAWWQGPAGPYWGHNAIIRVSAFMEHCRLPDLPGKAPWGGLVLSHDQVEAALMRRAGYEVRVLPDEFGSYELNPPCLAEFVRRDLRWCQGNLQYVRLIGRAGWHTMGRLQLFLAIMMYVSGPAWLAFMIMGFVQGVLKIDGGALWSNPWGAVHSGLAVGLLFVMLGMTFAPKIAGMLDALLSAERRRSYGGPGRVLSACFGELFFSVLLSPIMAAIETGFMARMIGGHGLKWKAQARSERGMSLSEAWRRFGPQTVVGIVIFAIFAIEAPGVLPWMVPVAGGLMLAVPFAWITAQRTVGRWLAMTGYAALPEELNPDDVVMRAVPWLAARDRLVAGTEDQLPAPEGTATSLP